MSKHGLISSRSSLTILWVLILGWSTSVFSDEDLYLKELEAEAGMDNSASSTSKSSGVVQTKPVDSKKPAMKAFETVLSNDFPTTFKTYKMLPEKDKVKVFNMYVKSDKDMEQSSRLLFELYYK